MCKNSYVDDAELVRSCQNGDIVAFEQLVRKYQEQIYILTYRMMNNREDAKDLTQETFLKVYQKIGQFNFRSSFLTWLCRLAVNTCIDERRKRKSKKHSFTNEIAPYTGRTTPEDDVISKEQEELIWDAISSLKDKDRAIIVLRDVEGLSYKEIAEIFKCSSIQVKSRLHEARKRLKAILERRVEL